MHYADESCDDANAVHRKLWELQCNRLVLFKTSLNKRNCFLFDSDSFSIVFDSRTSFTSISNKDDFMPGTSVPIHGVTVSSVASDLEVKGHGSMCWNFYTVRGEVLSLKIDKVLFMPSLHTRLLSPQQVCQQHGCSSHFTLDANFSRLKVHNQVINIPYDYSSNLSITHT